jgi:hypothetical protein
LRERTALNVNGLGLRRLVDRVRSEKAAHLPDGCPRTRSYPKTGVLALLMLSYMNADA